VWHGQFLNRHSLPDNLEVFEDVSIVCHESCNSLTKIQSAATACTKEQSEAELGRSEDKGGQVEVEIEVHFVDIFLVLGCAVFRM
jgi:hypothetical protein